MILIMETLHDNVDIQDPRQLKDFCGRSLADSLLAGVVVCGG